MENILYGAAGMILGVLMHFAKRKWKGQTTADVVSYFKTHFVDTLKVVGAAVALFIILHQTESLNFLAALTAGFSCDSAFNKAVGDTDKPEKSGG